MGVPNGNMSAENSWESYAAKVEEAETVAAATLENVEVEDTASVAVATEKED